MMIETSLRRPFAAALALAIASASVAVPARAGSLGQPVPPPRLAWLGSRSPSFERSTTDDRRAEPMPGIWGGLYAGLHGGYAWSKADPIASYDSVDLDAGYLGGHLGMNWQQQMVVLGLEGDLGWRWAKGRRNFVDGSSLGAEADLLSSLRLRAGVAFDNLLVYATGGIAFGRFDTYLVTPTTQGSSSERLAGYVFGGGVEMKLTDTLSGRVEALHYGFDNKGFDVSSTPLRADLTTTTLRAGLTYRFGQ